MKGAPNPPRYRSSGVAWLGSVPEYWEIMNLGKLAISRCDGPFGSSLKSEHYVDSGVRVVRLQNIRSATFDDRDSAFISEEYYRDLGDHSVLPGDLLVAGLGDENNPVGRACVAPGGLGPAMVKADCFRFRLQSAKCCAGFVAHQLSSTAEALAGAFASGSTRSRRNLGDMARTPIAVPPLGEQRAVAAFLDRKTAAIDQLIQKKERLIELLQEKRQALITQAVTKGLDPSVPMKDSRLPWIGQIPAHWDVQPLKRLVRPGTSITYGIVQAGPQVEGGVPYIRTSDMAGDVLPLEGYGLTSPEIDADYKRSRVAAGDVVVAIRATIGKALPVPPGLAGANLTQGTAKVSPGMRLLTDYLLLALRSDGSQQRFQALAKGATFREITLEMLRNVVIPVPPLPEQSVIVATVLTGDRAIDSAASRLENSLGLLREYRQALISAAVTGQIDVSNEAA